MKSRRTSAAGRQFALIHRCQVVDRGVCVRRELVVRATSHVAAATHAFAAFGIGECTATPIVDASASIGGRHHHRGTKVGAPERQVGIRVCLDQTFQDAGGWLMKVIDEDPIWRRNWPGSQICEKLAASLSIRGT